MADLRSQDGTIGAEAFWVSAYREGSPSVHGKVLVKPSLDGDSSVEFEAQGGIEFEWLSSVCRPIFARNDATELTVALPTVRLHNSMSSVGNTENLDTKAQTSA
jgi:hypothetical protein